MSYSQPGGLPSAARFPVEEPTIGTLVDTFNGPLPVKWIGRQTFKNNLSILQTDPKAAYLAQRPAIDAAISRVLESGWYILGSELIAFEKAFAAYIGCQFALGVGSGTDALVLALRALGVGPDDYVAAPSHTAVATVAAIELAGAKPLLIDIDPATYTLDAGALETALARPPGRIAAVIAVHLYGQPADLDAIIDLTRRHGIHLVEDCAQSHGAMVGQKRAGSIGQIAAFSFYPTKNLGALGDGGSVVTDDETLAERVRVLREHGWKARYISDVPGINSRLDALQAAVLSVKLTALDADNASRRAVAEAYDLGLKQSGLGLPSRRGEGSHVFHQYVVRSSKRDALRSALQRRGIGTNIHYPVPIHLQPAYQGRLAIGPSGLERSERAALEVLSLPIYPHLRKAEVDHVIASIVEVMRDIQ